MKINSLFFPGNPPLLLLPDNVRIRRYNISSEQYTDYIDNQERIQALDYDWDPEGIGLSEYANTQPSNGWFKKMHFCSMSV